MLAVFKTGGKQYQVALGQRLRVEKIEKGIGDKITFNEVLLVNDGDATRLGKPLLDGATVEAEVLRQARADKVRIIHFRRRKHSLRRAGHRQYFTEIKITGIHA